MPATDTDGVEDFEVIFAYQSLRGLLPEEFQVADSAEELMRLVGEYNNDDELLEEFYQSLGKIIERIQIKPLELLPVAPLAEDNDSPSIAEQVVLNLRKENYPAYLIDHGELMPADYEFYSIIFLLPNHGSETAGYELKERWHRARSASRVIVASPIGLMASEQQFLIKSGLPNSTRFLVWEDPENIQPILNALRGYAEQYRESQSPANDNPLEAEDRLNVSPDAAAFASLISNRKLNPPLSIAIFGNWGSGKSFFMHQIDRRIPKGRKANQSQDGDSLRTKTVYFNAWHYVDTDLWASLAATIFDELSEEDILISDAVDNKVVRQELLKDIEVLRIAIRDIKEEKQGQIDELKDDIVRLQQPLSPEFSDISSLLKHLASNETGPDGIFKLSDDQKKTLEEAENLVTDIRGECQDIQETWDSVQKVDVPAISSWLTNFKTWPQRIAAGALFLGIIAIIASPILWETRSEKFTSLLTSLIVSISPFLYAVREVHGRFKDARKKLSSIINAKRDALIAEKQKEFTEKQAAISTMEAELKELESQYAQTLASNKLKDYIQKCASSDEYKSNLGLLATLRNDFSMLSKLLTESLDQATEDPNATTVQRIVLFIDDLDRCPPRRVVEVLQAVHLLLAYRLFVVVVGVDSRWVSKCLDHHYKEILDQEKDGEAKSSDYLEKIFQIPYWLSPYAMNEPSDFFKSLHADTGAEFVNALAQGTNSSGGAGSGEGSQSDRNSGTSTQSAGRRNLDDLSVVNWTQGELDYVSKVANFAGKTPRATKRYFNLYTLLRSHPLLWPHLESRASGAEDVRFKAFALVLSLANSSEETAQKLYRFVEDTGLNLKRRLLDELSDFTIPEDEKYLLEEGFEALEFAGNESTDIIQLALRLSFNGFLLCNGCKKDEK